MLMRPSLASKSWIGFKQQAKPLEDKNAVAMREKVDPLGFFRRRSPRLIYIVFERH